jgi:hypothetical protein
MSVFKDVLNDESLILELSSDWSSQNPEYRATIRKNLAQKLKELGDTSTPYSQIMSLEFPPTSNICKISIAHTHILGGYVLSKNAKSIGLDLEEADRVGTEVLARVSKDNTAPTPTHGWCALEASFKAFSHHTGLKVLSQISVSNWELRKEEVWTFTAHSISIANSGLYRGIVAASQNHLIGICGDFA